MPHDKVRWQKPMDLILDKRAADFVVAQLRGEAAPVSLANSQINQGLGEVC